MLWSTVSKAFLRSRERERERERQREGERERESTPFSEPLSIFKYQSFVVSSTAVRVEYIDLKPC